MTTPPRLARPGTYLLTRRCLERRYFLKPSALFNNMLTFLVGLGCQLYGLEVHAFGFLSNHYHLLVTDPTGRNISKFVQWFNGEIARSGNCYMARRDHFWDSSKSSQVWIPPHAEDLIEKLAYVICNPVTSQLVPTAKQWPGAVTLAGDVGKTTFRATRPTFFFDPKGNTPSDIVFLTTLPRAVDAKPEELERRLRERCNEVEREVQADVEARGESFVGAKKVLSASRNDSPSTPDNGFGLDPHVACKDGRLRVRLLEMLKKFRHEYREARLAFCEGIRDVVFPPGTYLMVERFGCASRDVSEIDLFGMSYT